MCTNWQGWISMQSPESMTNAEIAKILNDADVIETWLKAVREYAKEIIEAGESVPGWKVQPKRGIRKWKDVRMVKQRLASEGLENFLVEEVASPTQVEKLAKKQGVQLDLFDLIEQSSSGTKLARETDKAVSATASAENDFAD
ncbi:hypothetical protein [Caudoviricetes sp.]|nr:hypothetical protein [Caudoviricetes sp.]